jgi:hypothetical protein
MRRLVAALALGALVFGQTVPSYAWTQGGEVGRAFAAGGINLIYVPAKLFLAVSGLAVGSVLAVLTAGDTRTAYAIWVPAATGTYVVTPENLDGREPLEFFGADYNDRPSNAPHATVYDAAYSM